MISPALGIAVMIAPALSLLILLALLRRQDGVEMNRLETTLRQLGRVEPPQ